MALPLDKNDKHFTCSVIFGLTKIMKVKKHTHTTATKYTPLLPLAATTKKKEKIIKNK